MTHGVYAAVSSSACGNSPEMVFYYAVRDWDWKVVLAMLQGPLVLDDHTLEVALKTAVERNQVACVELLLEKYQKILAEHIVAAALLDAALFGCFECLRSLLRNYPRFSAERAQQALQLATISKSNDAGRCFTFLLSERPNVHAGFSLVLAASKGRSQYVELLLERDIPTDWARKALSKAVERRREVCIIKLLEKRQDLSDEIVKGELRWAEQEGLQQSAKVLRQWLEQKQVLQASGNSVAAASSSP